MAESTAGAVGNAAAGRGDERRPTTGLTIARVHTSAGVHPYDEVAWERRDVVMTNWRDGTVNFEQRGVEFPAFWSVNATNIVTSKYFRGAVGTPQREHSLRQLIDRVVSTYVAAGTENGYFATATDAEIFGDELTWMLLHQVFSFNSPVWFNVGTNSPQQVSACLAYGSLVSTPAGPLPIGELVSRDAVGAKVYDAHGLTKIVATKANGVREVLRLHTKAGYTLDVTPDHVVWKSTGEGTGHWVEAGTLRPGEHLEWYRTQPFDESVIEVAQPGHSGEAVRLEIGHVEPLGSMDVYDIQTESGEFLAGGLRVHNCFILSVNDTMDSILNWYREEGLIFKGGSGAGLNLSRLRSSKELLSSGGTASGPVSFMRGADASAGTIKSGGATRRAAKMVVLDVDHPDIEEFVQTKAREEEKIRVLRDAGFDMDLGGADITSVQYQNANNSVRVTDEFMRAVEADGPFGLRARTTNEVIDTVSARKLFGTISEAAWACADPGVQYDDTINDWHTCPESGRITASNPCFPADQRVVTDAGLVPIGELVRRAGAGEAFEVYTNDVTSTQSPASGVVATRPTRYMITGANEIVELRFRDGSRLRCTPNHRVWTANRGFVSAEDLTEDDQVVRSVEYAPRPHADAELPSLAIDAGRMARGRALAAVPEKWTPELASYLGWLVGDGCLTSAGAVTVYGSDWERDMLLPRHKELLAGITGVDAKPSVQRNGTVQLRALRGRFATFLAMLGVTRERAPGKTVPNSIFEAPEDCVRAFLRGLFDADGCVVDQVAKGTRYVGLGSRSEELLIGVQELLASFGILARIYRAGTKRATFRYTRKDGTEVVYGSDGPTYDLRITGRHIGRFAEHVGFDHPAKAGRLDDVLRLRSFYEVDETTRLASRVSHGFETTYNLTEPRNHSYVVSGVVVANCSEYLHLDNSSCNLASLNLLKFLNEDQSFDATRFAKSVELIITAMDISICFADFPTQAIGDTTRAFRQLGIGYANLGALLMATGHGYDSEGGRALAAAITSLMTAVAYRRSAELAGAVGPYDGYARNAEPHQRVMRKHAAANDAIRPFGRVDGKVRKQATKAWQEALKIGERNGWRNAQASVLAPTGCLTGDTMITTDRGLARLGEIGDVSGDRWQDLDMTVSTDDGERRATKFFVNGEEPTRQITTAGGYRIQGTLGHRIKVVDPSTGGWEWKRLADVAPGDLVPVQLGTFVGTPRSVPLPVLDGAYYSGDRHLRVPDAVDADLAELVGYFMGDGSLHAKGVRLCVADTDLDVIDRLRILAKGLFGIDAAVTPQGGYHEVMLSSIRLARWWRAAGFAKRQPTDDHVGKGWEPHVPSALLESNDLEIYAAFVRGLFEADGTVADGVPSVSTASERFAGEVRTVLLALGMAITTRETTNGWGGAQFQVRLRNLDHALTYAELIGFVSARKDRLLAALEPAQSGNRDRVQPGYLFERVRANADGGVQPTYDLSVPDNVTYVAAGFVSHNTIGLMMDCDTTGVEPDLALVKFKKLVGGGSMQIVNQTVPRALASLGYQPEQVEAIVEFISEHGHVVDAPGLRQEHYEVFDCAMGERSIAPMGHVRMMAAVQPFISGAISKCVTGDTLLPTTDGLVHIGSLHRGEEPDTFRDEIVEVAGPSGSQKTDAFYYGGTRPVREVELRSGHRVVGTPNHRVLVAAQGGPQWRHLAEVQDSDYVAVQYGTNIWASTPARFDDFQPAERYGRQKVVRVPQEMSEELAFLLGAYASEGHTTAASWTIRITNSVDAVLTRVVEAWRQLFGVNAYIERREGKCPEVVVASKTIVEFLRHLGSGSRASAKRIPDAILCSPRPMVLAFLQGLSLDAYVRVPRDAKAQVKWAICLDSAPLLDDLQAVLANLGVVHGRISKLNKDNGKSYDEVYASGEPARFLAGLVPFLEPDKAASARRLIDRPAFRQSTADVVPGISGPELYEVVPWHSRGSFRFLLDGRTRHVSRATVERVAAVPGVDLPRWLADVLRDGLHFSPVQRIRDAGEREVYDVSVPTTHAFVGNGIVNHNTVNMPEAATVADIEQIYLQGWKLGLKALAIYRDNCKVGQPLSQVNKSADAAKASAEAAAAHAQSEPRPVRRRLPKKRPSQTVSFTVGGAEGYLTAGSYPDDGLGEIFVKMSKQGSTLAGVMDAFSIAISIALQYGVPLETYVSKFVNMRFEPAGMTDDPDVRIATSVVDYLFRRAALDYLPYEKRVQLGILSAAERTAELDRAAAPTSSAETADEVDIEELRTTVPASEPPAAADERPADPSVGSLTELVELQMGKAADAPLCMTCGTKMRPAGSCYVCEGCGSTSGCS